MDPLTTLARPAQFHSAFAQRSLFSGPCLKGIVRVQFWDNTARDESDALHPKCSVFESIHGSEHSLDFAKKSDRMFGRFCFTSVLLFMGSKQQYSLRNEILMKAAGFKCRWMMTHYFSIDVFSRSGFLFKRILCVGTYRSWWSALSPHSKRVMAVFVYLSWDHQTLIVLPLAPWTVQKHACQANLHNCLHMFTS